MDVSWRMRMGIPSEGSIPRRRSTERPSETRPVFSDAETITLDPEAFADVFGGPPRSAFWRKASSEYASVGGGNSFYEEIFRPSEIPSSRCFAGRGLPVFRIPGSNERFYSDVFGSDGGDDDRMSRERSGTNSKAKSKSSSVLSSEEMSPLRSSIGEHVALSDFSSKLRPIHVPSRRNTTDFPFNSHVERRQNNTPTFYSNRPSSAEQTRFTETDQSVWSFYAGSGHFGFSRRASSPETISVERDSYPSVKISVEDADDLNSPSSAVSSDFALNDHITFHGPKLETRDHDHVVDEDNDTDSEDDDDMSSYVIEFGSDHREGTCDAVGIDDAIAWAKEKFQTHCEKEMKLAQENNAKTNEEVPDVIDNNKHEIIQKSELSIQDENIQLWSFGKETDIRLLLSTLHFILWSNSGWCAIPLTNIIESSQVKKAYQKARLCLHPDKLQQRGATISQKYVANKAFSILQDAWASFITQDVIFSG